MELFSDRHNLSPKKIIQKDMISPDLKTKFWNIFFKFYGHPSGSIITSSLSGEQDFYSAIWTDYFMQTVDEFDSIGYYSTILARIKINFFNQKEWWKYYDFIEFVSSVDNAKLRKKQFQDACNDAMKKEMSGYRFINEIISPIIAEIEILEVETAIELSALNISQHLQSALILLSDKESPDYRNSIKESISAVESMCQSITGSKATLGKALKFIEKDGKIIIHPALKEAFSKIYGWASADSGIRHALQKESNIDLEDAQFMLVACSAFINYLRIKTEKTLKENLKKSK